MENGGFFEVIGILQGKMMENDEGSGKKAVFPLEKNDSKK